MGYIAMSHKFVKSSLYVIVGLLLTLMALGIFQNLKTDPIVKYETIECISAICVVSNGKSECTELSPMLYGMTYVKERAISRVMFVPTNKACDKEH